MKSAIIIFGVLAFHLGCSGMIAPTNEDGTPVLSTEQTATVEDPSAQGETPAASDDRAGLGALTDITGDLEFNPVSAYASITESGATKIFTISFSESTLYEEDYTKVVKEYECVACDGDCDTTTSSNSLTVSFMDGQDYSDPFNITEVDSIDDNGMPAMDTYEKKSSGQPGVTVSFYDGTTSWSGGNAAADIVTFETRPTAIGDEFKLTLDASFFETSDTTFATSLATWKGTINTKVIAVATQTATYPTCADGEYAKAIYE